MGFDLLHKPDPAADRRTALMVVEEKGVRSSVDRMPQRACGWSITPDGSHVEITAACARTQRRAASTRSRSSTAARSSRPWRRSRAPSDPTAGDTLGDGLTRGAREPRCSARLFG